MNQNAADLHNELKAKIGFGDPGKPLYSDYELVRKLCELSWYAEKLEERIRQLEKRPIPS